MFKNYIKITLRNLYRQKLYALINIFGLSLGIGCCLVLGFYVAGELSYDRHWENHERIYRVANEYTTGSATSYAMSSQAFGPLFAQDNPEAVEAYTRFRSPNQGQKTVFRRGTDTYFWSDVYLVDLNVFDVFDHDIIYGDADTALDDGLSIAVSQSFAESYFGDENPLGQTVSTDTADYTINLVFADLPETTHFKYDVLLSMNRLGTLLPSEAQLQQQLGNVSDYTYLKMTEDFDPAAFRQLFDRFEQERVDAMARTFGLMDDFSVRYRAQPLADVHLQPGLEYDMPTGNLFYIVSFAAVALFILVIACINYVNLATARAMQRAREVGMRKVLGAQRAQLVWQFLGESLFFVLIALLVALVSVAVLIEYNLLADLLGGTVSLAVLSGPGMLLGLAGLAVLVGLGAGLYPAFYLSSLSPAAALSGASGGGGSTSGKLRQLLVFVQFTISIGIIASTLLMANQLRYVSGLSLGFDKENKLLVPLRGADVIESLPALRTELSAIPGVLGVSTAQNMPGGQMGQGGMNIETESGAMELQSASIMVVGEDFLPTMGIPLLEGRDFSQKLLTDVGQSFIVNRALVDRMGWDQPLGKRIQEAGRVIGVVDDFHFASLYQPVAPLLMIAPQLDFSNADANNRALVTLTLVLNIAGNGIGETLGAVRDLMQTFDPLHPFEYEFLDDQLDDLYASEQAVMRLTSVFAAICVFISCLGLFGLASFTTERRTREIGVRKVLGASSLQIIALLARSILLLVLAGALVASILSFVVINEWLNSFAYRDGIDPLVFLAATALAVVVAYVTVAAQAYRTVRANPVIALRYE